MRGRRANDWMRRATGSMTGLATTGVDLHPWQAQAAGHRGHLLFGELLRGAESVVDGGHDQVLEHLDVVGIDCGWVDRDADELLLAGHRRANDAAARGPVDHGGF